jgi:hypothetical protein
MGNLVLHSTIVGASIDIHDFGVFDEEVLVFEL